MTNAPRQGQPDFFTQDLNRKLQSFRPSRAGLLLWCHIQGFARSAHPWLISSHPFGVEELRPIGGADDTYPYRQLEHCRPIGFNARG